MGIKKKISKINIVILGTIFLCVIFTLILSILPNLKQKTQTVASSGSNFLEKYKATEEANITDSWDISANEESNVIATLTEDGTLTISGTGKIKDWEYNSFSEWHSSYNKSKVKNVIITKGVTNIGAYMFCKCNSLTSVEIQEDIKSIGRAAFLDCSNLINIEISEGVRSIEDSVFVRCSSLTNIEIPKGVTNIGGSAFSECSSLTNIEIPEGVTNIGDFAFSECSSLTSIEIPEGVTNIEGSTFYGCSNLVSIEIPNSITSIGECAFSGCRSLISIKIPEGVTCIEYSTFYSCGSLNSIKIPEGVTSIGECAFLGCSSLTSIIIPDSVTNIGNSAFSDCRSLISIEIPEGVTNIEYKTFNECSSLYSIKIPEGVTSIGEYAFSGCSSLTSIKIPEGVKSIEKYLFYKCSSLTSIELPAGIEKIETYSFFECIRLTNIELKKEITSVGYCAFYGCRSLMSIKFLEGVTNIDDYAFKNCILLKNIELKSGLNNIGKQAFYGCSSLSTIELPISLNSIGDEAFFECISLTRIEIPSGIDVIKSNLFNGCSRLKSIKLPTDITEIQKGAFKGCSSLTTIELPSGVKTIENDTFRGCSSLTTIKLPNELTSINSGAFYECSSLTMIKIPDEVTTIGYEAFYGCKSLESIKIPEGVDIIENSLFSWCTNLTSVDLPNGITRIGRGAFEECNSLINIEIPDGVTTIGEFAFLRCNSLTNIELPSKVTSIEDDTFRGCNSLTKIEILEGVTNIGDRAFQGCSSLINIELPSVVPNIGAEAFYGCNNLTDIKLPEAAIIGNIAFFQSKITKGIVQGNNTIELPDILKRVQDENDILYSNDELVLTNCTIEDSTIKINEGKTYASIEISSGYLYGLTYILSHNSWDISEEGDKSIIATLSDNGNLIVSGTGRMKNWDNDNMADWFKIANEIKTVIIEEGITNIGSYAFQGCDELKDIVIPKSVEVIGENIFNYEIVKFTYEKETLFELPKIFIRVQNKGNILYSSEGIKLTNCTIEETNIITDYNIEFAEIKVIDGYLSGLTYTICYGDWDISKDENNRVTAKLKYGDLYISGRGEMNAYSNGSVKWEKLKKQIKTVYIEHGVTNIQSHIFEGCKNLTTIYISSTVTKIENNPFIGCTKLTQIRIDNYDGAYEFKDGIIYGKDKKEIVVYLESNTQSQYEIPKGISSIAEDAFANCKNLTNLIVHDRVTEIGDNAFIGCDNLTIICKENSDIGTYVKENNINYKFDNDGPIIQIIGDWESVVQKNAYATINATDGFTGLEEDLKYLWSTESENITKEQITNSFENGQTLEIKDVTGIYYLWIYAIDKIGNETIERSAAVNLDNSAPITELIYSTTEPINKSVIVTIKADERIKAVNGWTLSDDEKQLTKEYTENTTEFGENIIIMDLLENKVTVNVKVTNIVNVCESDKIISTVQKVDEENLVIKGIKPGMTVEEIKNNLQSETGYEILDKEGKNVTGMMRIGTGYKVKMANGKEYTIIVWGDFNGDGQIGISELAAASRFAVQNSEIEIKQKMIIDVSMDGKINTTDLAALSRLAAI